MLAKLILVRHGQSVWNLENRFTGFVDVGLSEQGVLEAHEAAKSLKGEKIDLILTSGLKRAHQTLEVIVKENGLEKVPTLRTVSLNERHYGDLQGLNKAETAKKFGDEQVLLWRRSYNVRPPGGESLEDTVFRVKPVLDRVIKPALAFGNNVLVVAHGNSNRAIFKEILGLSENEIVHLELETGKAYSFEVSGEGANGKLKFSR